MNDNLSTVVIYDQNNMESTLTAACLASVTSVKVSDARSLPPEADRYVWLNVFPSRMFFQQTRTDNKTPEHVAFVEFYDNTASKHLRPQNVEFIYCGSTADEEADHTTLGRKATLLERVLRWFDINPSNFALTIERIANFYKSTATEEDLIEASLNMHRALTALRLGAVFVPTRTDPHGSAEIFYKAAMDQALRAIKQRSQLLTLTQKNGENFFLMTFYETDSFWMIRRRLTITNTKFRNISYGIAGALVETNVNFQESVTPFEPVFIKA